MEVSLSFVFGLFVYIRQASLSLHRSNIDKFPSELVDYYRSNMIPVPKEIIQHLKEIRTTLPDNTAGNHISKTTEQKNHNKIIVLSKSEIDKIMKVLEDYSLFFTSFEGNRATIVKNSIRLSLTNCSENLGKKIPGELVKRGNNVKHVNQNEYLRLSSFEELVGVNWPES